jgi:hypothetical protein
MTTNEDLERFRAEAMQARNTALASLCTDALRGDVQARDRVTAIMAGEPDPGFVQTQRWFDARGDMITLAPLPAGEGGHGFHVKLHTARKDIGSDFLRQTYHSTVDMAARQVAGLMERAGGTWQRQQREVS